MFRHVLVHAGEHPSFALGQPWPGLLTAREEAILAEMEFLPRRRKWLLGRAAAKGLVMGSSDHSSIGTHALLKVGDRKSVV